MHKFKKSLGQNFLKFDRFALKLLEPLQITPGDVVLEIGPGDGRVTNLILASEASLVAIEKDYSLIPKLISRFNDTPGFELEHTDVLDVTFAELAKRFYPDTQLYKLAGSLPYNISKRIIEKAVTELPTATIMSFIVQEEVAKVYVAKAPKATFLSNWIQLYADVKKLLSIPASQFYPAPKVNGAILVITPHQRFSDSQRSNLSKLIRIGFISPRKTLWNNISSTYPKHKNELSKIWVKLELPEKIRPAELEFEQWTSLAEQMSSAKIL